MSETAKTHSTEGLMALVQTYADQEVQCVARSEDEAYWGLFRERERIGDGIRSYLEAMVQHAYAEGRKDEAEEHAASRLIDAWVASHGAPIPWEKAVEIIAIVNKLPEAERTRLLGLAEES